MSRFWFTTPDRSRRDSRVKGADIDGPQVYFAILENVNIIKIGFTRDTSRRRVRQIAKELDWRFNIIAVLCCDTSEDARYVEGWLHSHFSDVFVPVSYHREYFEADAVVEWLQGQCAFVSRDDGEQNG